MSSNNINYHENRQSISLRRKVFGFINYLMNTQLPANHFFHNWHHTFSVVQGAQEICESMFLSVEEEEIVLLAAWFHDSGHINNCIGHEEESKKIARDFFVKNNYPMEKIEKILQCIAATKIPQAPSNLLEEIICDADLYHLSSTDYLKKLDSLRKEWALINQIQYSEKQWLDLNLKFLKSHKYFTRYGKENLDAGKQQNIQRLEKHRADLE